jgi:ferredoxin/flavodoxin---NADP+ reductase
VDWAISFLNITDDLLLVHRRHDFRAHIGNVEKIKATGKVLTPYVVKELIGDDKTVKQVVLENTEDKSLKVMALDALMVFYGSIPQKQHIDIWQVETDHKGIRVKSNMETSRTGIYAVGNCVYYPGKLKMIGTGFGEAATAIGAITNHLYPERKNPYLAK